MKPSTLGFIGVRLREAREARGLTVISLADLIGISRQAIYQYENGTQLPRPEVTKKLSSTLSVPISYFLDKPDIKTGNIFYRSMSAATKSSRLRGEARYRWFRTILSYLNEYIEFPEINFPNFDVPSNPTYISNEKIEELAIQSRNFWDFSSIPINNMVLLLENNGAIVTYDYLYADALDAFSDVHLDENSPFCIVLGADKSIAVRSRFDAAHEIGHKILHRNIDGSFLRRKAEYSLMEKQAHRFAAAFLLPANAFANDFYSSNLDTLLSLKPKWKVSVAMMIKRAGDLNFISSEQEKRLWINLSRRGWRTKEPLDDELEIERPQVIKRAFEILIKEKIKTKQEILSEIPLSATDIEILSGLKKGYLTETTTETSPTIRILKNYRSEKKGTQKHNKPAEVKKFPKK